VDEDALVRLEGDLDLVVADVLGHVPDAELRVLDDLELLEVLADVVSPRRLLGLLHHLVPGRLRLLSFFLHGRHRLFLVVIARLLVGVDVAARIALDPAHLVFILRDDGVARGVALRAVGLDVGTHVVHLVVENELLHFAIPHAAPRPGKSTRAKSIRTSPCGA